MSVGPIPSAILAAILDGAMRGNPSIAPNPNGELLIAKRTTLQTYVNES